jgi:hypothetical protein
MEAAGVEGGYCYLVGAAVIVRELMLLSKAHVGRMRNEPPRDCPGCGAEVSRNYCRDCEVFFFDGHSQGCADIDARAHRGCPTYAGFSGTIEGWRPGQARLTGWPS